MKTLNTLFLLGIMMQTLCISAQESGNANYGDNDYEIRDETSIYNSTTSNQNEMVVVIKGIYNEKATLKIATFSLMQLGKTAEETTSLMDERLDNVKKALGSYNKEIEIVTDMISFVPTFAYEVEKKIFNPKTYNEKPTGFELKKNLIIKFKNPNDMDKIVSICSQNEIYDLAKVDYTTSNFDSIRDQMQQKAFDIYKAQLAKYALIMNTDLTKKENIIQEGFNVSYPMENYKEYAAFSQADANFGSKSVVHNVKKNDTQYYDPTQVRNHNFVVNPHITEPALQLFYELTVRIKLREDQLPKNTIVKNNQYYLILPNGNLKRLEL